MPAKYVPDGFSSVTPYLIVTGVARLLDFLTQAFGADELSRHARPDGTIMHASVRIGDSVVMMGEPVSPWSPMPASVHLYVPDVDATFKLAMAAGGVPLREPETAFYGDRTAGVKDPSGNHWWIATHVEDVAPEELERRSQAMAAQAAS